MTTTCQDIINRAQAFSSSNGPLTVNGPIMLSRIRADQSALYSKMAEINRDFFSTTANLTSTSGGSGRSFSIGALTPPVERVLMLTLASGVLINQVDPLYVDGELAPRYISQGTTLIEVGSDWGPSGTVSATLTYVQAPIDIDPNGSLAQTISIPDRWSDLLTLSLALYLFHGDVGRDPAEGERLQSLHDATMNDIFNYLGHFGGVEAKALIIPSPSGSKS